MGIVANGESRFSNDHGANVTNYDLKELSDAELIQLAVFLQGPLLDSWQSRAESALAECERLLIVRLHTGCLIRMRGQGGRATAPHRLMLLTLTFPRHGPTKKTTTTIGTDDGDDNDRKRGIMAKSPGRHKKRVKRTKKSVGGDTPSQAPSRQQRCHHVHEPAAAAVPSRFRPRRQKPAICLNHLGAWPPGALTHTLAPLGRCRMSEVRARMRCDGMRKTASKVG